ncbi:MAG: hypothetical protein M1823_003303 [Watsoniomyces obsoletus]|nr:MAG: hypothetical protein M1823_003303 [Watsoniomyces obsoletus]
MHALWNKVSRAEKRSSKDKDLPRQTTPCSCEKETRDSSQTEREETTIAPISARTDDAETAIEEAELAPPPDGGARAWVQVLMSHLVVFNTWGYINSFGAFQTYYMKQLGHPPSDIAWVGSVQIFLLFFIGAFSGRATDAGFFHTTTSIGSVILVVGIFMTSLATRYWHLFLAQGVCIGIGNGLLFCPTVAVVATYFTKRRSLALGLAACGSATGGMVIPAMVRQLLPQIGFPWTVRVLGLLTLVLLTITNICSRTRLPPRRTGPLIEWAAFKENPYTLFVIGCFLTLMGLFIAFYYVTSFGRDVLHLSQEQSVNMLLMMNGMGVAGRLLPNHFGADGFLGPLNTMIPFVFCSAFLLFSWTAVHTTTGLLIFSLVYGFFASGIQSLFPATCSSLTTDLKKAGVRMGMIFSIVAFACLIGPPIAGALIQLDHGGYLNAQVFGGSVMVAGASVLCLARVAKTGWKLKVRA